jgi:hypothetical protein
LIHIVLDQFTFWFEANPWISSTGSPAPESGGVSVKAISTPSESKNCMAAPAA